MVDGLLGRMLLVPALFVAIPAAAAPWAHDWTANGRLAVHDKTARVAASANGHVLVGNQDGAMAMFDAAGSQRWATVAIGPMDYLSAGNYLSAVIVDDDGSAWYTSSGVSSDGNTVLTRVGADGRLLWSRPSTGSRLARVADGVIVAGCGNDYQSSVVSKVDIDGALVWQRVLPRATCGYLSITAAADGGVYVLQYDMPWPSTTSHTLSRLDAAGLLRQSIASDASWPSDPRLVATPGSLFLAGSRAMRLDPSTLSTLWSVDASGHA